MIDLRSDTVTKPTAAMRAAMADAIVGDDQYGEDETVNRLEARAAEMLGKEAAVFVASGTMGNLSALLAHCARGEEALLGDESHIFWYESGGPSTLGGIPMFPMRTDRWGRFDLDALTAAIRPMRSGFPRTGVVCVENTHNRCGGVVLPIDYLDQVRQIAHERGTPLHMDGARIFNAAAFLGIPASAIAATVDSVQFCLSKGLGAPVGSIVAGDADYIAAVRRQRKVLGGAMRQAGVIAAAGLLALETMVDRLTEDHDRARRLAVGLAGIPGLTIDRDVVQSNIVVFKTGPESGQAAVVDALREAGLLVSNYGARGLRMVTHHQVADPEIAEALTIVEHVMAGMQARVAVHA